MLTFTAGSLCSGMAGFADLIVWQEAASLAANVEDLAPYVRGPAAQSTVDQMVRAAKSIPANIAEGYGRGVNLDCIRFLKIAKSSCDELENHLRIALMRHRIPSDVGERLIDQTRRVGYLIFRFQESVERRRKRK